MSYINKNNYEAFLLDYVEQNLSPEMVAELMLFLEQNPDLKTELDEFENTLFVQTPVATFEHKADIKQAAIEELMIAELEGLNNAKESAELQQAIKENALYASLFANYQKTILVPEQIVYADKNSLKHKETKVVPINWWISSAAAVLFVVFTLNPFVTDNNNNISSVDTRMFPIENNAQSFVDSSQSSVDSLQFAVHSSQLAVHSSQPTVNSSKSSVHSFHSSVNNNKKPATSNQQPATSKEMIEIEPFKEKEYIEIEPFVAEEEPKQSEEFLTVSEALKKEAQKRLLENEVKTSSKELVAANVVAKVLGKNAEVETTEDASGEVKEYALNIGGFSLSRKIRK
ncbi:MAG: hypothetical protein F9K09_02470 [Flavobacteriales bacterium]|nr:MAG: hypothetical protein F9K09_02470 [Flavobacteriales bacterium]